MKQSEKRILIVDDDENILRSLGSYLSLKGYIVDTAKTGKEAVEKSENCFFNLAVLDIKLPDMDGTELLKKMRETEPKMMRIMLTGYPSMQNAIESLNKRADAYLIKPVELEKLLKLIQHKLKEQENEREMDQRKVITYMESRDRELDEKERKNK